MRIALIIIKLVASCIALAGCNAKDDRGGLPAGSDFRLTSVEHESGRETVLLWFGDVRVLEFAISPAGAYVTQVYDQDGYLTCQAVAEGGRTGTREVSISIALPDRDATLVVDNSGGDVEIKGIETATGQAIEDLATLLGWK